MRYNKALAQHTSEVELVDASLQRHRRVMTDGLQRQIALARHIESGVRTPFKYVLRGEKHTPMQWWTNSDDSDDHCLLLIRYGRTVMDANNVLRVTKSGLIKLLEKILADVRAGKMDRDLQAFARSRGLDKPKSVPPTRRARSTRSRAH